MHSRRHGGEDEQINTDRWLTTYADMMNNLLVLFMVLYALSVMNNEKFKALSEQFSQTFGVETAAEIIAQVSSAEATEDTTPVVDVREKIVETQDEFDEIYYLLKKRIGEGGFEKVITLEQQENYIIFTFNDSVLFYPDSPVIKPECKDILGYTGDLLYGVDNIIKTIEIGGHTASSGSQTSSFFAWELSADRAIAVLKFMTTQCKLPQSKMSISGFSKYHPIADNSTESGRVLNRRVEIKITRIDKPTSAEGNK